MNSYLKSIKLIVLIRTCVALGTLNVLRVIIYQIRKKMGLYSINYNVSLEKEPFFREPDIRRTLKPTENWYKEAYYFGWFKTSLDNIVPPDWFKNPQSGLFFGDLGPWFRLPDFCEDKGDIKWIWEASRFSWVLISCQRIIAGDIDSLKRLNFWLGDWLEKNPPYLGVNWKCGQEGSLRVLNLAMGACILGQERAPSNRLIDLIELHLKRIKSTFEYALAQNNNHSISEAVALFVGGSWLASMNVPLGLYYERVGRKYIEKLAHLLIMPDGSYSQYSINYHAVMLEMFSVAEIWRRKLNLNSFSDALYKQLANAVYWLAVFVNPETGDAPNIGANDSSRFFQNSGNPRDLRTATQLAAVLFSNAYIYEQEECSMTLHWFDVAIPEEKITPYQSVVFDSSGFAVLKKKGSMLVLRYPRFKFRPSQCDILHLDFWCMSENILRDAGSYTYASLRELFYFSATKAHNTIEFNRNNQMLRVSRFLFGDWLNSACLEKLIDSDSEVSFAASYVDRTGAFHKRKVALFPNKLIVVDTIDNFEKAVLRWRLAPLNWNLVGNQVRSQDYKLTITASMPIFKISLKDGWESRYYLQKVKAKILEIQTNMPGVITTTLQWDHCLHI